MDDLLEKSIKLTLILVVIMALGFSLMHQWRFGAGLLVGASWSVINFFFLLNLLKIAILKRSPLKLSLLLLVKFPVLYLVGFLILVSKFFYLSSLLFGSVLIILVAGAMLLWTKRR